MSCMDDYDREPKEEKEFHFPRKEKEIDEDED